MRRFLTLMFAAVCAVVFLVVGVTGAGATVPPGRIVFSSTLPTYPLPGGFDLSRIYSVGVDGRRIDLSANSAPLSDEPVSLSPNRSRIAFKRSDAWWLMNADGSGQRLLLAPGAGESLGESAIWSPDGTKLAIEDWSDCYRGPGDTCTDTGGSVIVDLAGTKLGYVGLDPAWSPDGTRIASEAGSMGSDPTEIDYYLTVTAVNGSSIGWTRPHVSIPVGDCLGLPAWSPNGRWMAALTDGCEAHTGVFPYTLYVFPAAGGAPRDLVRVLPETRGPIWSPDGSRLAYPRGDSWFLARGDATHPHVLARRVSRLSWSPGGKRLAFVSGHTLFLSRGDGTHTRALAMNTGSPLWSPDGRSLAFIIGNRLLVARSDGTHTQALASQVRSPVQWAPDGHSLAFQSASSDQIAVVGASGGPAHTLTDEPAGSLLQLLSWSQDSKRIIYTSKVSPARHGLWTVNPDGSGLTRVTTGEDHSPAWSSDGQRIAFEREGAIYTIHPDGSGLKLLVGGPQQRDWDPAWSPDGHEIVFRRSTKEGHSALFLINADGTRLRRLTRDVSLAEASPPAWSPDGSEIAYADPYDDGVDLIRPDGTGKRILVKYAHSPAWSPDGSRIAYTVGDEGERLSLINADGTDPHAIVTTNTTNSISTPSWSPDGTTIVYAAGGHLYTIDTDGNNRADLTPFPQPIDSREPNWSHP